jgi:hypothetical protein
MANKNYVSEDFGEVGMLDVILGWKVRNVLSSAFRKLKVFSSTSLMSHAIAATHQYMSSSSSKSPQLVIQRPFS